MQKTVVSSPIVFYFTRSTRIKACQKRVFPKLALVNGGFARCVFDEGFDKNLSRLILRTRSWSNQLNPRGKLGAFLFDTRRENYFLKHASFYLMKCNTTD